jgi:hypothetical protein
MKLLFLLLLLGNVLAFAVFQSSTGGSADQTQHRPIRAEQIRLLGEPAAVAAAPVKAPQPTPAPVPVAVPPVPPQLDAEAAPLACLRWGPIAAARLDEADTLLAPLKLGDRLVTQAQGEPGGPYWVYVPPLANKTLADAKLNELANAGVKDLAVVRVGKWENAISLGLYAKLPIADARMAELRKKGVQNSRIEARGKTASVLLLNQLDAGEQAQLQQIQQAFGDGQLKTVACR